MKDTNFYHYLKRASESFLQNIPLALYFRKIHPLKHRSNKIVSTAKKFSIILIIGFIAFLTQQCANPVMPQGGPKDNTPPEIIGETPVNGSVLFNKKSIEIQFNEYVKLVDAAKNILISPPMRKSPEYKIRHKSVVVDFKDTLRSETTYKLSFGNSIVDITEGNAAKEAEYVFSTGTVIDSMQIKGTIINAFDLKPAEAVTIMLYPADSIFRAFDSLPYKETPYYLSRSDKSGAFAFSHLRNTSYFIFALKDINSNYLFDNLSEEIAFVDSLIFPWYKAPFQDSIKPDSAVPSAEKAIVHQSLKLFKEHDSTQRVVKRENPTDGQLHFIFQNPVKEPQIQILGDSIENYRMIQDWNKTRDTLNLWVQHLRADTISFSWVIRAEKRDTVQMSYIKTGKSVKKKDDKSLPDFHCGKDAQLNHFSPFRMFFNRPVLRWEKDSLMLIENTDTVFVKFQKTDSIGKIFTIKYPLKAGASYELKSDSANFTDFMGNKTLARKIAFKTKPADAYGELILTVNAHDIQHPVIIQLLDDKEKIFRSYTATGKKVIRSGPLLPQKFTIKAIFDRNGNGQWDSGKYLFQLQPEKVLFFKKTLEIRANWDLEEEWTILP